MNVTEFAEQIVFGKTLEDKLIVPGKLIIDTNLGSGPNIDSLVTPGRARGLQMCHDKGIGARPPSDDQLENEQARGQLLHFLANHELLATELMALVLLKFPDAPHAFRRGVLVTLQEEQEHTRMYMRRMKECGVEFGSFPLSGQFWRVIEPMQSPMDFVSRLSLTFEQANLDYSLHFANVFRNIGDAETSTLLQQIYEDEIGHVQHGLHWFRQWKNPDQSDWDAYQESLDFPMSPQRGRGPRATFNRDGRLRAGLTDAFIDAIEVFRQSRGRAPTVRWFDPSAESELAGDVSPKVELLMEQLGNDLELALVATSKEDDVLLVRQMPSREIRKQWIEFGFDLPEFVTFENRDELCHRKLDELMPWAWTPKQLQFAQPLFEATRNQPEPWSESWKDLYRKTWSANCLKQWLGEDGIPDWFSPVDCVGMPIFQSEEVAPALAIIAERGYASAIFKQDLAASGRGQRRFDCRAKLTENDEAWLRSVIASPPETTANEPMAIVEPELNRVVDLSFLWSMPRGATTPNCLGWTRPLVTPGRRYAGTRLGNAFLDCDEPIKRFLLADRTANIQSVIDWLEPRVTAKLAEKKFSGHFGIDAFVYQTLDGQLKIKPMVELNPRMTMGHVALGLRKRLGRGVVAEFRVLTRPEWEGVHKQLESIPFTPSGDGQWKSGVIWFGAVDEATKLIPVLLIGTSAISILRANEKSAT